MGSKRIHKVGALVLVPALLLVTSGLVFVPRAHAAQMSTVYDTISDSRPSVLSNHDIKFTTPTGIVPSSGALLGQGESFTINFGAGGTAFTGIVDILAGDVDILVNGVQQDVIWLDDQHGDTTAWGVSSSYWDSWTLAFKVGTDGVPAGATVEIKVGTNATNGGTGVKKIVNPSGSNQSYVLTIGGGAGASGALMADKADLRIAIVDAVAMTASIDTTLAFTLAGVASGQSVNGDAVTTSAGATATTLPFGILSPGTAKVLAQTLSVTTNATNGFAVTVVENQELTSANGASIHLFKDDSKVATPTTWTSPLATLGTVTTYGHYGITSEDADLNGDEFGSALYAGNIDTARTIFSHTGPADGSTANKGQTRVAIKAQISSLQPAATDYTNRLTYVATPVF